MGCCQGVLCLHLLTEEQQDATPGFIAPAPRIQRVNTRGGFAGALQWGLHFLTRYLGQS